MTGLILDLQRMTKALTVLAALFLVSACGPKDQEECIAQAARDAKNATALQVLTGNCQREFPARRRDDGSYTYYDSELADWVDVSGPKLSSADVEKIRQLRVERNNVQAQVEQERQKALSNMEILSFNITCNNDERYIACYDKSITINIRNNSKMIVNGIYIDYEIGNSIQCSGALGKRFYNPISIGPGGVGSIVKKVMFEEAGPNGEMNGCVRVGGIGSVSSAAATGTDMPETAKVIAPKPVVRLARGTKPAKEFVVGKWGTDGDCKLAMDLRADGTSDGPFGNWSYSDGVISFADASEMKVEVTVIDRNTMTSKNSGGGNHKMTRCP